MIFPRNRAFLLGCAFVALFLYLILRFQSQWNNAAVAVKMGDVMGDSSGLSSSTSSWNISNSDSHSHSQTEYYYTPRPQYAPGVPKPPGSTYTKMIVAPRTSEEDTNWMTYELPDWETAVYVADDPEAPLHPPKNKGHEVIVYLTYIIDFYDNLPDIVAFMHSHQFAWHVDEIFGGDTAVMLQRLNPARVIREGYMNLRCIWAPGCPDWMHPGTVQEDESKQEEVMLAHVWREVFPQEPVPDVLAQPCCAQFAVSRERILTIPKSRFVFYRDWVMKTDLSDYISGRAWEYLWHVIFTGQKTVCPKENVCYCDGYGVCFGGDDKYDAFRGLGFQKQDLERELEKWNDQAQKVELAQEDGRLDETTPLEIPEPGKDEDMLREINEKGVRLQELIDEAVVRGDDPKNRAYEAGRPWKEGDWF